MDRKTREFKKLEDFLKENDFNYMINSNTIIIFGDSKSITLIYRNFYETWKVVESWSNKDGEVYCNSYEQYLDIIIEDLKKMKRA